jgi:DNA-binding SARP family transcriptional activator
MRTPAGRAWPVLRAVGALILTTAMLGGIPYALAVFTGWPLPRRLPAWAGTRVFLTSPLTNDAIIKALACLVWLLWLTFTLSVIMEVAAVARSGHTPRLPVIAPVQALAAALIGAAMLTAIPVPHMNARSYPLHEALRTHAAATAPPRPDAPGAGIALAREPPQRHIQIVVPGDTLSQIAQTDLGNWRLYPEIFRDSRHLEQPDGYRLTDPNDIYPGERLWIPPAGRPGERPPPPRHATPPAPAHRPPPPAPGTPAPHPGQPGRRQQPHGSHRPGGTAAGHPGSRATPAHPRNRPVTIALPGSGIAGITLAAAISAALVAWRLHRRRLAVPRWPIPDDQPEPPLPDIITRLRRAHLDSIAADTAEARGEPWPDHDPGSLAAAGGGDGTDDDGLDEFGAPTGPGRRPPGDPPRHPGSGQGPVGAWQQATGKAARGLLPAPIAPAAPGQAEDDGQPAGLPPEVPGTTAAWPPPPGRPLPAGTVTFGVRGNTEIPLDTIADHGLGLTGPGAPGAARALIIALLSAASPGSNGHPRVVIPQTDASQLLHGHEPAAIPGVNPGLPGGLTVTATLPAALDLLETEIIRRLRIIGSGEAGTLALPPLALVARPDRTSAPRIQAILAAGPGTKVTAILLGNWPTGITCDTGPDGTVTAATSATLTGARAFCLSRGDTATLLALLRGASGHTTGDPAGPYAAPPPAPPAAPSPQPPPPPANVRAGQSPATGGGPAARPPAGRPEPAGPAPVPAAPAQQATVLPAPAPAPPRPSGLGREPPPVQAGDRAAGTPRATGTPPAAARPVQIEVLGPLRITAGGTEIHGGLRKARELLAFLTLHPGGASGEVISEALWPGSSPRYGTSQRALAVRRARGMLRAAIGRTEPMYIILASERYRLDPSLTSTDLWQFNARLDQARAAASDDGQLAALRDAVALYHGPLAEDAGYDWAERYAEPLRRRVLDALARIAEILQDRDPGEALTTLETALAHDPYNEAVYQKIMGIQARLGRLDAARRTLSLLETRLTELGVTPGAQTRQAAATLLGPPGPPPSRSQPPGRSPAP